MSDVNEDCGIMAKCGSKITVFENLQKKKKIQRVIPLYSNI